MIVSLQENFPDTEFSVQKAEKLLNEFTVCDTGRLTFDEFLFALSQPNKHMALVPGKSENGTLFADYCM